MKPDDWPHRLAADGSVEFRPSPWRLGAAVGGLLVLAAGGIAIAVAGVLVFGALLAAAALGLAGAAVVRSARGAVTVRVAQDGLDVGGRRLDWADVTGVRSARSGRMSAVALELTPAAARRVGLKRSATFYLPALNGFAARPMASWLDALRRGSTGPPTPTG
jgi:hypothetical protein